MTLFIVRMSRTRCNPSAMLRIDKYSKKVLKCFVSASTSRMGLSKLGNQRIVVISPHGTKLPAVLHIIGWYGWFSPQRIRTSDSFGSKISNSNRLVVATICDGSKNEAMLVVKCRSVSSKIRMEPSQEPGNS